VTVPGSKLEWKDHGRYWSLEVGNPTDGDGVTFHLEYYGTCYRRGPWKLVIEVAKGNQHHLWGCFDDQDQPMRWYHTVGALDLEVEAIAAVLLTDRKKTGVPITGHATTKETN